MAKSLADIVGLVSSGDKNILEEQEKSNKTLESIDRNMKAFLAGQKNERLDNLESSREKTRKSGGSFIKAGAIGVGLAAATTASTGDGINPLAFVGAMAVLSKALKLTRAALSGIANQYNKAMQRATNVLDDVNSRLDTARARLAADIDDFEKAIKKSQADFDRAAKLRKAAAANVARLKAENLDKVNDPRSSLNQDKIRIAQAEAATRRAQENRAQKAIERFSNAKDNVKLNQAELERVRTLKGADKATALRNIQDKITADAKAARSTRALSSRIAAGVDMANDPRSAANQEIARAGEVTDSNARAKASRLAANLEARIAAGVDMNKDPRSQANLERARMADVTESVRLRRAAMTGGGGGRIRTGVNDGGINKMKNDARILAIEADKVNDPKSKANQNAARLKEAEDAKKATARARLDLTQQTTAQAKRAAMDAAGGKFKGLANAREIDMFQRAGLRSNVLAKSGALAANDLENNARLVKNEEMRKRLKDASMKMGMGDAEFNRLEADRVKARLNMGGSTSFGNAMNGFGNESGRMGAGGKIFGHTLDKGGVGLGLVTGQVDAYAEAILRLGALGGNVVAKTTGSAALKVASSYAGVAGRMIGGPIFQAFMMTLVIPTTLADGTMSGWANVLAQEILMTMVQGGPKAIAKILKKVKQLRSIKMGYEDLYNMSDADILALTVHLHAQHTGLMAGDDEASKLYQEYGLMTNEAGEQYQAVGTLPKSDVLGIPGTSFFRASSSSKTADVYADMVAREAAQDLKTTNSQMTSQQGSLHESLYTMGDLTRPTVNSSDGGNGGSMIIIDQAAGQIPGYGGN